MYIFNKLLNDKQKQLTKNPINFSISKIKLISFNPESDLIKPYQKTYLILNEIKNPIKLTFCL